MGSQGQQKSAIGHCKANAAVLPASQLNNVASEIWKSAVVVRGKFKAYE